MGDTLHSRDVYHNHPDGRPDWMETQNGQGVVRSTRHYIYDADDRLTGSEDREADGTPKSRVAYYFTPQRVLERTDRDTDADGDVDKRTTHIYDAEGHRIEDRTDTDMDGTADDTITYANNGLGNPETVTTTTSGGAVTIDHYQYDDVNRVSVIRVDFFGDETINRVVSYLYDAAGRLSAMEGDEDLDGTLDWRWTISYDC